MRQNRMGLYLPLADRIQKESREITAYVREHWGEETEQILRIADDACENTFLFDLPWDMERTWEPVHFADGIDWEYLPGDDPEFTFQLNRHRFLICMGQAYAMTGDEKYTEHFMRLICDWLDKNPVNDHTRATTWRSIEAGIRGEYWLRAAAYFAQSERISEEFSARFRESLREHARFLEESRRGMQISSNWGVLENHGMYMIGAALGGEEGAHYCGLAMERLAEEARIQVLPDGMHWEQSSMYHNEVMHCFLEVLRTALEHGTETDPEIADAAERMALAALGQIKPNHHHPMSGDSDDTDQRDMLTSAAYLLMKCGRTKSASWMKYVGFPILDFESIWDFGMAGNEEYSRLEAKMPEKKDWYFEDTGTYCLRSGWDEKADYLRFKNGFLGNGHGHSDKLHFDWCVCGEDVLMDSGRYSYVFSREGRWFLKSVYAHNSLVADGREYMDFPDSWGTRGTFRDIHCPVLERGGIAFLAGGHTGYLQDGDGAYVERKILRLEDGLYLLSDTGTAPGEHTYSELFHFNNRGEVQLGENEAIYRGEHAEARIHFVGEGIKTSSSVQKMSRFYNAWEDHTVITAEKTGAGLCPMMAVLCGGEKGSVSLKTRLIPVENPVSGRILPEHMAQGVEIQTARHTYVVILRHHDLINPADLLRAEECMGMGRVLIAKDGANPVVFG